MLATKIMMLIYAFWGTLYDIPNYLKCYVPKEGDIVVDCGAYSGIFTKCAAKKVGKKGKVIAFEPDPENYKILKRKLRGMDNVIVVRKGISDHNGTMSLKRHPFYGSIGSTISNGKPSKNEYTVLVGTLDSEIAKLGISSVDFIKMDIEGSELEAVKGMKKILNTSHPNLAIACYHKIDNQETSIPLKKMLSKYYTHLKTANILHKTLFAQRKYGKSATRN